MQTYLKHLLAQNAYTLQAIISKKRSVNGDTLIVQAQCMRSTKSVQLQVLNNKVTLV